MVISIRFTKSGLEKLQPKANVARTYYKDEEISTLHLAVFASGKKTFYLYKRIGNSPSRIKLGIFPDMTVEQARKTAMAKLGEIAQGSNPADKKRHERKEISFGKLFARYMEKHAKPHKKSFQFDQDIYNYHLKGKWENTRLSDITSDKIRSLHSKLGETGKTGANRVLDVISSVFSKAIEWELYDGENPVRRVKKFKMKSRDRFILPDEMPRFFKALEAEPNETAKDYIYISLYTGARKGNVLSMRWDELNLNAEQPYWRIPDDKSKNAESMHIPLSKQALKILKKRQNDSEFVFPSTGRNGYLADPKKAWKRVLDKAGISNLRLHDLRRTLGSWLAASGANSFMIGKALGHKSIKSTAIYARLSIDPVAASVDVATKAMVSASKKTRKKANTPYNTP